MPDGLNRTDRPAVSAADAPITSLDRGLFILHYKHKGRADLKAQAAARALFPYHLWRGIGASHSVLPSAFTIFAPIAYDLTASVNQVTEKDILPPL